MVTHSIVLIFPFPQKAFSSAGDSISRSPSPTVGESLLIQSVHLFWHGVGALVVVLYWSLPFGLVSGLPVPPGCGCAVGVYTTPNGGVNVGVDTENKV